MTTTKVLSIMQIEMDAAQSELSYSDYTLNMWIYFLKRKNQRTVNKIARELNVFPKGVNVYHAVCEYLFSGISVY